MANDTAGNLGGDNTLGNVVALIGLLQNKKSTTTTSSDVSGASMDAMLQKILSSTQGLAAVSSGQRAAGGYNSTVNTQLVNDLLTRSAGEIASQNRSGTSVTRTPGALSGGSGQLLAALAIYSKLKGNKTFKQGTDSVSDWFGNLFGGGGGGLSVNNTGNAVGSASLDIGGYGNLFTLDSNASEPLLTSLFSDSSASTASGFNVDTSVSEPLLTTDSSSVGDLLGKSSEVVDAATTTSSATSAASSSSGGSSLSYLGNALDAYSAYQGNKDYRKAVGGTILSAFGYGYLTPVADKLLRPASDNLMREGNEYGGIAGSFYSEPIGTLVSGRYDEGDFFSALTDPADLFGGNEGGSVGAIVGASVDPIGAALGGKGISDDVSDAVNNVISKIFGW